VESCSHAIKFSVNDGRVEIHLQRTSEGLQITVNDNGQGISPAFLPHVFERFRQKDASSTREAFGLGLGLSIAKHLVELHGGTITALSAGVGCGASFTVRLPAVTHSVPAPTGDPITAVGGSEHSASVSA
jgi:signal transduction histidine kinase